MKPTRKEIRQMNSLELKKAIFDEGRSMTNYERSQYCKKLKEEGQLHLLNKELN